MASSEALPVQREALREALLGWFESRRLTRVRFVEDPDPPLDEEERLEAYQVNYLASFEPDTLQLARVEVWGSVQGGIGVGFERRDRMAQRLGVRCYQPGRFVGGSEPGPLRLSELVAFLDAVADGQIAAVVTVWPWLGLTASRAVAPRSLHEPLRRFDPSWGDWLRTRPRRGARGLNRLLEFGRWV